MAIDLANYMTADEVRALRAENVQLKRQLVEIDAVLERDGKLIRQMDGRTVKRFAVEQEISAYELRYTSADVVGHISGVLRRRIAKDLASEVFVDRFDTRDIHGGPTIHLRASIGVVP